MLQSKFLCSLIQSAWMGTCLQESLRFRRAANNSPAIVQANVLASIIRDAQQTEYGRQHGFARIRSAGDFQARVPINDYDDLKPWINRIADGCDSILTADKVLMFEETSGTTAGSRLVPYTAGLQRAFNRALHPWLLDLYCHNPALWGGPAYWVITPKVEPGRTTTGGVPIGFAADSDYFGSWARPLINSLMAVSDEAGRMADHQASRYFSALSLLRCSELRLISLWNPTFFTALISSMAEWAWHLEKDLSSGTCHPGFLSAAAQAAAGNFRERPQPHRADRFKAAVSALQGGNQAEFAAILWPRLAMISSWDEAEAASGAAHLRRYFPDAAWQTKGLLATEGAVTLPMTGAPAPVLAARTAFFEFAEGEEGKEEIKLAHELETGGRYRVIMTTFGGLYRYRLHDIVEMRGWWRNLPCLAFVGKEAMISDLCGEKLNGAHVKSIIAALSGSPLSAFIAPQKPALPDLPGYVLVLSHDELAVDVKTLAAELESALCTNFHYRWCREAGQLEAASVFVLPVSPSELNQLRLKRQTADGLPVSTAKLGVMTRQAGWVEWLGSELSARRDLDR